MNLSRRRIGAIALIVAGIGAFMVPFLLRAPGSQGTSPTTSGNNNNNNNNNNGGGSTTTTTSGGGGGNGGSGGNGNNGNCAESKSHDPKSHDPSPHGNAYGVLKNKLDTTVALVKAMGVHDPAFHLHHDTDTDNDTTHGPHGAHGPGDHDSSCAAAEEEHDKD